jgi:hypothetical protein
MNMFAMAHLINIYQVRKLVFNRVICFYLYFSRWMAGSMVGNLDNWSTVNQYLKITRYSDNGQYLFRDRSSRSSLSLRLRLSFDWCQFDIGKEKWMSWLLRNTFIFLTIVELAPIMSPSYREDKVDRDSVSLLKKSDICCRWSFKAKFKY